MKYVESLPDAAPVGTGPPVSVPPASVWASPVPLAPASGQAPPLLGRQAPRRGPWRGPLERRDGVELAASPEGDRQRRMSRRRRLLFLTIAGIFGFGCGVDQTPVAEGSDAGETGAAGAAGAAGVADRLADLVCAGPDGGGGARPVGGLDVELSLRDAEVQIGLAVAEWGLDEPGYAEVAAAEFNAVTAENEMKWSRTEPAPGEFDFAAADRIVEFAEENDMAVRGHTLVWHSQLPGWVEELTDEDDVRAAMTRHIEEVVAHFREAYPGRVAAWDVVNEALDADGGYRNSVFFRALGDGFIAEAFELAHRADPDAKLYYNDFGIEGLGSKSDATVDLVEKLVDSGVPIHGVGFQMHTQATDSSPTLADFRANLARYARLGIEVNISEMDVSVCRVAGSAAQRHRVQQVRYNQLAMACLTSGVCNSITIWGLADGSSWLNWQSPCDDPELTPSPLLFDDDYQRKPAWAGLMDALVGCSYR
jgi:endo-1,4-beta-xylanase